MRKSFELLLAVCDSGRYGLEGCVGVLIDHTGVIDKRRAEMYQGVAKGIQGVH